MIHYRTAAVADQHHFFTMKLVTPAIQPYSCFMVSRAHPTCFVI